MQLNVGTRVAVESESTERPARVGVIEEVLREAPSPRYRFRWELAGERPLLSRIEIAAVTPLTSLS